ncbi:hypothetical protein [Chryseobacterium sp.]|nr:hypothetical protein [Chryseobacterium sp.]
MYMIIIVKNYGGEGVKQTLKEGRLKLDDGTVDGKIIYNQHFIIF